MNKYLLMHDIAEANRGITERGITFIDEADQEELVSYRQLYERSRGLLHDLQACGVEAGHELLIQIQDNRLFLEVFWACVLGRIIAVPVTVGTNEETRLKVCKVWGKLNRPHLIGPDSIVSGLEEFAAEQPVWQPRVKVMKESFIDAASLKGLHAGEVKPAQPDDIAFIQFSSGSTGDPKGVILTHQNVMSNVAAMQKIWGIEASEHVLSWMPLTHDMGLIAMHLLHAFTQSSQYIMRTKLFILNPLLWIEKTHQHRINRLYSPNFGYNYFLAFYDQEHDYGWDLSRLTCLCNGAEPISTEISERFVEQLAKYGLPRTAMRPAYGLAEGTVGVCFTPIGEPLKYAAADRRFMQAGQPVRLLQRGEANSLLYIDVGPPIDSCEIRIADEAGQSFPESTVGYIQIKGPSVTQGYYNDPNAGMRTADGWLNTADIGFVQNGRLSVVGRAKDILFVNGQNVFAHDIERVAEEVDGVELWNVAACGAAASAASSEAAEEILLFLLYRSRDLESFSEIAERVKQHIHRKMGLFITHVIPVRSIPKTTSGKIQRFKLSEQYSGGLFDGIMQNLERIRNQQSAGEPTEQLLHRLCRDLLGRELGADEPFQESGGSSLILTQLSDQLAKWHGISVSVPDLYKYPTIAKLTAFIDRGGSLSLPGVPLEPSYFNGDGAGYMSELEATLEQETCEGLRVIAGGAEADVKLVLLAGFFYLLKLASGERMIHVQVVAEELEFVTLTIDFNAVETMDTLLELVGDGLAAAVAKRGVGVYSAEELDRIQQPEEQQVVPLFVMAAEAKPAHMQWHDVFDFVIEPVAYSGQIEVLCGFNGHRLREVKAKELLMQYMLLLADIVGSSDKVSV
ncbi:non-ribosomal peptide synthetase [Paenibacillus pasadenensis]|uniref:non-ribosomal peptide synthetase n=1 Tax=Paenibacillus pasadenensis TaxID=217090 RepID=UPI00204060AD|nr:non-ribosomal peptide synthetase [Paenibacillus pasadenensis]MCM3746404.1 non-ribosomal peptide synthetase [Paenibacillus pasadenensis]